MSTAQTEARAVEALTEALVILARTNIPTDVQELLVSGDPMRSIPPGVLSSVLSTLAKQNAELHAQLAALKKEAADVVRPFVEYTPDRCFEGNERWKPAVCRDPGGGWYGAEDFRAARSFLDKWEGRDG
jgi:hypothetical protein